MHLLYSTLCSNSSEFLVFSSRKMLWRMVTMVLKPFTRRNKKIGLFLVAVSAFYSQNEIYILETTGILVLRGN